MNNPTEDTPVTVPEQEIEHLGRTFWVQMPTPEQLLVWQRTVNQLQGVDVGEWNGAQAMKALNRLRMILDSVLAHETDIEWLDDEMLAGRVGLRELSPIIEKTVHAFADAMERELAENGTRAERRATKKAPAKKAARKAPARKAAR